MVRRLPTCRSSRVGSGATKSAKRGRRWAASSNRTYEPAEERKGILATVALIGVLAVLGVTLLAVSPGAGNEVGEADGDGGASGSAEATPDDLSFLCEGVFAGNYINLEAEARDRVERAVEEFVLTAYEDPGTDPAEYERSVEGLVVGECFWGSPASGYVNDMEEVARGGGKANAPSGSYDSPTFARELSHFQIDYAQRVEDYESGANFTKVVGTAVWVSEESNGDPRAWQQSITAVRNDAGGEWKILSGQSIPPSIDREHEHYLPPGV